MRHARIMLILLAVVLTLIILNLLTERQRTVGGTLFPQEELNATDSSGADPGSDWPAIPDEGTVAVA
jgi:hypothetical protein